MAASSTIMKSLKKYHFKQLSKLSIVDKTIEIFICYTCKNFYNGCTMTALLLTVNFAPKFWQDLNPGLFDKQLQANLILNTLLQGGKTHATQNLDITGFVSFSFQRSNQSSYFVDHTISKSGFHVVPCTVSFWILSFVKLLTNLPKIHNNHLKFYQISENFPKKERIHS